MKKVAFVNALVITAIAFAGCQSQAKRNEQARKAALKKQAKVAARQENTDVDLDAFVSRLRKVVAAHDLKTLASMMVPDFAYVLGATPDQDRKGDGVFQYWDENDIWPELQGILSEKFVKKGEYMVAPPQFADPSLSYDGYRAGIRRINGSWKFVYFVNG
ncbi:MAG: hypothetical protein JO354_11435 [Verrucomicrobia bacterium]|nr:hypothetical protein [Verrucomicrobiota bacterium]